MLCLKDMFNRTYRISHVGKICSIEYVAYIRHVGHIRLYYRTADRKLDIGCIDIIAQQVLRWMLAHK